MRDVNYGWLIRYIHMNGASFFFIVIYIHIFRGLYYGSYKEPRELLWMLGVVILLLMMATAFMGYVLPWGQMSFWGATVITNLFSAHPRHRQRHRDLAVGRLRGRQPDAEPLLLAALPAAVRDRRRGRAASGGAAPARLEQSLGHRPQGAAGQHPVPSLLHDQGHVRAVACSCSSIAPSCSTCRTLLGDPANYIPANPLQTPPEIVPEWYFLPFYAILRSIPNKLFGVVRHVRLDPDAVPPAVARHLAGAERVLPAGLQVGVLAPRDRLLRARLCRRAPARRRSSSFIGRIGDLLLLPPFLRPDAADRLVRAAAAAAAPASRAAVLAKAPAARVGGTAAMEKH